MKFGTAMKDYFSIFKLIKLFWRINEFWAFGLLPRKCPNPFVEHNEYEESILLCAVNVMLQIVDPMYMYIGQPSINVYHDVVPKTPTITIVPQRKKDEIKMCFVIMKWINLKDITAGYRDCFNDLINTFESTNSDPDEINYL